MMCQVPCLYALQANADLAAMPVQIWVGVLQAIWESSRRILGGPGTHEWVLGPESAP